MTLSSFIPELTWRGLFHQQTHASELDAHLSMPRLGYAGFDPTADSLTIGNLVPLMMLKHWQRLGHRPVIVVGGGTGLIGDPSGKSVERLLLTEEQVRANVQGQMRVYEKLLDFSSRVATPLLLNNADWLCGLGYIEILRDIGKHFSVNQMIQRDVVRERLHHRDQGISYTEFSYLLLQSYDFYYLAKQHGVSVQMGGSDQYGNILSGCDLIRRLLPGAQAFGVTAPLLTKSDGTKFGKTESGSIWLTADRTSPYEFYQFFLNSDDRDVMSFLKIFTFLTKEEIDALEKEHEQNPGARLPHRTLARAVTEMVHGAEECEKAQVAASALFSGDIRGLSEGLFLDVLKAAPSAIATRESVIGLSMLDALMLTSLVKSKREARDFFSSGSILCNGQVTTGDEVLSVENLLHGKFLAFRRGKKHWFVVKFE